jgi:hypothetical protein
VIANPGKSFTTSEVDSIAYFVRRGGRLLVLDDPRNLNSSTNESLGLFNMKRDTVVVGPAPLQDLRRAIVGSTRWAGAVRGGRPLLLVNDTLVVAAEQRVEQGRVTVFMNSFAFTDAVMGATGANPDPNQRRLYDLEYWFLRRLMAADPDTVRLALLATPGKRGRR